MKKTRSILEELNTITRERDRHHIIESRGHNIIESAINLLKQIEEVYNEEDAKDLSNRLINSIRGRDSSKFTRGIKRAIAENKHNEIK
jgi:hypothetical protein